VITVIGPGTGLGVAMALRRNGRHEVVETEGGHLEFAPLDEVEQRIVDRLRGRYGRVSAERIVSGPGLANIYDALAKSDGGAARIGDDAELWASALDGSDPLAATALDRLCMSFGSVAGDIALAQGASAVVITGNLAQRMADRLRGGRLPGALPIQGTLSRPDGGDADPPLRPSGTRPPRCRRRFPDGAGRERPPVTARIGLIGRAAATRCAFHRNNTL
jgi:glucokinase